MNRRSVQQLVALAEAMSERDKGLTQTIAALRLVCGRQLERLFFADIEHPPTRARRARRILGRLVDERVLDRLERRLGGVRGGSGAYVYALGPVGRRIVAYWSGAGLPRSRSAYEPSVPWVAHTVAVSELYVRLREAERGGRVDLLAFDAEPTSWRSFTRIGGSLGTLKPDAYARLGIGAFEDSWFIEVDRGTERRGQLLRQHRAYYDYFRSGVEVARHGVFPSVLWVVPDERRAALLRTVGAELPDEARGLFTVAPEAAALDALLTPADNGLIGGAA